jgi:hypothetical protein
MPEYYHGDIGECDSMFSAYKQVLVPLIFAILYFLLLALVQ